MSTERKRENAGRDQLSGGARPIEGRLMRDLRTIAGAQTRTLHTTIAF